MDYMVILVLLWAGSARCNRHTPRHYHRCRDPTNFDPQAMLAYGAHESIHNIPAHSNFPKKLDDIMKETPGLVHIVRQWEFGERRCYRNSSVYPAQKNTTCPWHFVRNIDYNRYPQVLFEANCSCVRCLDFLNHQRTLNRCQPVPNYIRVVRRIGCENSLFTHDVTLEPLPTGCMCTAVMPATSYPQGPNGPTIL